VSWQVFTEEIEHYPKNVTASVSRNTITDCLTKLPTNRLADELCTRRDSFVCTYLHYFRFAFSLFFNIFFLFCLFSFCQRLLPFFY